MIPRLKLGRPGRAFRTSFTMRTEFIGTSRHSNCGSDSV